VAEVLVLGKLPDESKDDGQVARLGAAKPEIS
jgi:hypothetical protein